MYIYIYTMFSSFVFGRGLPRMSLQRLTGTLRGARTQDVQKTNTLSMQFNYGLRPNDHSQEVEIVQFISNS